MNLAEAMAEANRLSVLLDNGLAELRKQGVELANAEHDYRRAKSEAWVSAPKGTVPEREAHVNGTTAKDRLRRDIAEAMSKAALEAVRSRRGQISALQTLVNADIEESKMARTGPDLTGIDSIRICQANTPACPPGVHRAAHRHHVRLRSQGGGNEASNLIDVCASAHDWIHANPREAAELGFIERAAA